MKKILIVAGYAAALVFAFGGATLWSFWNIVHPDKIDLQIEPEMFSLPAKEITLLSRDRMKLSAWFIESTTRKSSEHAGAVILLHGYPSEKDDMLSIAADLYPDFTLLIPDLRYFGKSDGAFSTLGIKERFDVETAVNFLQEKGYGNIGIFGYSLGGSVALLAADIDARIRAVAAYAPFADYFTMAEDMYSALGPLKKPVAGAVMLWAETFFHEPLDEITPVKASAKLKIPVLIIHGKNDEQIPFHHAEMLEEALRENSFSSFYFYESGSHNDLPADFTRRLKDFFTKSFSFQVT